MQIADREMASENRLNIWLIMFIEPQQYSRMMDWNAYLDPRQ